MRVSSRELAIGRGPRVTARVEQEEPLELNQPVFTERDGEEIVGLYRVEGDVLHVAVGRYATSAELRGSNPEVLAHVLLDALVDDIVRGRRAAPGPRAPR
jgi:hypothetical protein